MGTQRSDISAVMWANFSIFTSLVSYIWGKTVMATDDNGSDPNQTEFTCGVNWTEPFKRFWVQFNMGITASGPNVDPYWILI